MGLQYLTNGQIDKIRWDECINKAANGLIYGYSFYLDAMSKNWDALVLNDYETVMPLTWNKKYGVHYLYQPPFTASLGVFGNNISGPLLHQFLQSIPAKFKYWDISLNPGNDFLIKDFNLFRKVNFLLNLNQSHSQLSNHFRDKLVRYIKKSLQAGLQVKKNIEVGPVIALAKKQAIHFSNLCKNDFLKFAGLYELLNADGRAMTYGVYDARGLLMASAVFFLSNRRAYYIMAGNHPDSRALGASHTLINAFIKDHAGQDLILDFEGSDIKSLAFFYNGFGAKEENYPGLRLNRLPLLLKWIKNKG